MKKAFTILLFASSGLFLNAQVVQKAVVEEFTGAWCGYCPDGALILEGILDTKPNAIGISIHNGDGMVTSNGNLIDNFFNTLGFPSGVVNRQNESISRNLWSGTTNTALLATPQVSVSFDSVDYDEITRALTVMLRVEFLTNQTGTFRINLALVQDEVTGTGSSYNQVNYYNGTAGHPYYGTGNPIVGFVHSHVLRSYVGGGWGTSGIITTDPTAGSVFTHTYTATLGASWDEHMINMVALVAEYNGSGVTQRKIVNAEELHLSGFIASKENNELTAASMSVFPNPTSEKTTVVFDLEKSGNLSLDIFNLLGQHVSNLATGFMTSGTHSMNWNLRDANGVSVPNGTYFVKLSSDSGEHAVKRIVVSR